VELVSSAELGVERLSSDMSSDVMDGSDELGGVGDLGSVGGLAPCGVLNGRGWRMTEVGG
jgi:hypothetical protein